VLGEDPYPLGLRAMGENVERAIRGSMAQGLLTKPLRLEDIYYRTISPISKPVTSMSKSRPCTERSWSC